MTRATVGAVVAMLLGAGLAACNETTPERHVVRAEPPAAVVQPTPAATSPVAPQVALSTSAAPTSGRARVAAMAPEGSLTVRRLVVAHAVRDHEPVESDQPFRAGGKKVYAFVEIENRGHVPGEIRVEFEAPDGGPAHRDVALAVGDGARWRTWAYTRTAKTPGTWTVIVKSRKGDVLAKTTFDVIS